jgi:hypothetical protein
VSSTDQAIAARIGLVADYANVGARYRVTTICPITGGTHRIGLDILHYYESGAEKHQTQIGYGDFSRLLLGASSNVCLDLNSKAVRTDLGLPSGGVAWFGNSANNALPVSHVAWGSGLGTFHYLMAAQDISGNTASDAIVKTCFVKDNAIVKTHANRVDGGLEWGGNIKGGGAALLTASELLTLSTGGATSQTANLIPAGALVFAVTTRVTTAITTATSFDVGITGATTRYATGVGVSQGTNDAGTDDAMRYYASATPIDITCNTTPGAGVVRVTVHYILVTPPTVNS